MREEHEAEKVSIVMAMYKPDENWLAAQLRSLNDQEYPAMELLVWNDCPEDTDHEDIFRKCVTRFPFRIYHGQKNKGYIGAFEELTRLAEGRYIAYCDQDDIWHPDKISTLVTLIEKNGATLACSDTCVIDENGKKIADSILNIRSRQTFVEGEKQVESLLVRNFVIGCTMIVTQEAAKAALPFIKNMVHDHWLALWNSAWGKIVICYKPLIDYRLHGDNQTAVLTDVQTKEDYIEKRVLPYCRRMEALCSRSFPENIQIQIAEKLVWAQARRAYLRRPGFRTFWTLAGQIRHSVSRTGFDLLLPFLPDKAFRLLLQYLRRT